MISFLQSILSLFLFVFDWEQYCPTRAEKTSKYFQFNKDISLIVWFRFSLKCQLLQLIVHFNVLTFHYRTINHADLILCLLAHYLLPLVPRCSDQGQDIIMREATLLTTLNTWFEGNSPGSDGTDYLLVVLSYNLLHLTSSRRLY